MQTPVGIPRRDIPHSEAVETRSREKIEKLDRFHERVMSCRVTVESPQHRKHQGKLYSVHIDMKVPGGGELVVNRMQNEGIYVAIRAEVEFVEEMGNEGPQARMVSLGKHHVPL